MYVYNRTAPVALGKVYLFCKNNRLNATFYNRKPFCREKYAFAIEDAKRETTFVL